MTPFLFYFCNEVYNRLQVDAVPPKTDLEVYQTALAEGKITEKERLLWEYVLSAYGAEEFTTKQLEKDFRNAAYATIRTFVMKFHEMGLLKAKTIAEELGLVENKDFFLIRDACHTELEPEEFDENGEGMTLTCIGFRPLPDEIAHQISHKFHLY